MNRAKKLSGAEFKKKRRNRLEIDNDSTAEVAATSLITDLNSYHPLELIEEEIFIGQSQDEFGPNDSEAQEDRNFQLSKLIEMGNSGFPPEISEISATSGENFQHSDPATWPKMTDKTRCFLIQHGPEQERREFFPNTLCDFDNRMRHFSSKWYEKNHPNGEKFVCYWLLYSNKKDSLFCFCCLLFSTTKTNNFSEISKGFCECKKLNPRIPEHENSNEHQRCYSDWKNLEKNLNERKTLDSDLQRFINGEMKKWRDILKVIVDAILFCVKNNLALRGSTEVIGEQNSGIFLNLIELISHYYPLVAEHVASVKAKKTTTSYFSPRIQNELIELLGQKVRNEILSNVREAKYYSVLFDCTPDASHKEQMTQIIRYVYITEETCTIEESFVDFIESHEKTGKGLAAEITEKLEKDGLSISDSRGQGYDNGANMSGKYNGVQAHIHSLNEFARFKPCAAHTLNLVGVHAAEVSPLMIRFFGKVQAIFNFFSSSTLRWEKLMKTLTISLKGNSDTRWSAKKEAIIPLHRQIKEVLQASIQNLIDVGVDTIIKAAAETAIQIGIEGDFPMKRKRKVKPMALYEAEDDFCRLSPETDFGSQCNLVFDSILTQIEWRFEAMSAVSSDFDLSGHSLSKSSVDELKTKAKNLFKIYKTDLDSSDFQSESASFKYQAAAMMENFEKSSPMDILQLIHKYSLTDAYPNTAIAIRIFLTLPVTVTTCERSFSKLKIIKNYLRSTMGQERLSCLAVVSIEHEVANALDFDDVISDFASKKARKVTLN
ncbi:uncharacterized protein LOC136079264 [Hydra vulgaris]|uniref:Uncharacterized protein LOC136079264 n=1 Tax=Hydra vulgaris TaxID=6087 RepID=A0ABM4BPL3_HYDVU